jgi:hypothetical protein
MARRLLPPPAGPPSPCPLSALAWRTIVNVFTRGAVELCKGVRKGGVLQG